MIRLSILLILCLCLSCNKSDQKGKKTTNTSSQKQVDNDAVDGWKTLNKGSFSIDYPADWELDLSGSNRTSFVAMSPKSSPQDRFRENINLMVNDLSAFNYTLDEFVEISESQIKEVYLKPEIIESERKNINGAEVHDMQYLGTMNTVEVQFYQRYQLKNNKSYILSYSAEPKDYSLFEEYATKAFESFTLK